MPHRAGDGGVAGQDSVGRLPQPLPDEDGGDHHTDEGQDRVDP